MHDSFITMNKLGFSYDSNEALFHYLNIPYFMLNLQQSSELSPQRSQIELSQILNKTRLQRHVGVVYKPQDEMASHYSRTHLAEQFDAIIYHDISSAVSLLKSK